MVRTNPIDVRKGDVQYNEDDVLKSGWTAGEIKQMIGEYLRQERLDYAEERIAVLEARVRLLEQENKDA